jgi:hypothetical protein
MAMGWPMVHPVKQVVFSKVPARTEIMIQRQHKQQGTGY